MKRPSIDAWYLISWLVLPAMIVVILWIAWGPQ